MNQDLDILQESDFRKLHVILTSVRIAIQRHRTDPSKDRNKLLYTCLPENGGRLSEGVSEAKGSATFCRIQIIRLRKAIREHMIDKNDSRLYKLLEEEHSFQIRFPETLIKD